jgi:hypothetical protein
MKRYNIFNQIHKGLRVVMYETATLIQQTDFSQKHKGNEAIFKLSKTVGYFHGHSEHEDHFIFPLIARVSPATVAAFEEQHSTDEMLMTNLESLIARWYAEEDPIELAAIGLRVLYDFNDFVAFNIGHMNKEEKELNEVLWAHYTDAELAGVTQQIVASIPQELLIEESRFMMRAANNQELLQWMTGIKMNAPKEVYGSFLKLLAQEISPVRFEEIEFDLSAN